MIFSMGSAVQLKVFLVFLIINLSFLIDCLIGIWQFKRLPRAPQNWPISLCGSESENCRF